MDILILGGTVFLGRAIAEAALAQGHSLTLFNRGKSNPDLFSHVEQINGDRAADLGALAGRHWDAVIDTSGYVPRVVRLSAERLAEAVNRYVFISSLSVYADSSQPGSDENRPVGRLEDESVEQVTGETYGPLKALCEQAVERALPGRSLIIRPGLIVGPYDISDRFTYWPARVARGGEVLAPDPPERGLQVIDVRDLAEWTVRMVENQSSGVFNANGPAGSFTMGELLETCQAASGSTARFTWVSEEFLTHHQVGPWMELPLWIPDSPEMAGFYSHDVGRAIRAGLTFRPLVDTVQATLAWEASRPTNHPWKAGLSPEREVELLRLWKEENTA